MAAPLDFDDRAPWGTHAPSGLSRALIRAGWAVPGSMTFLRGLTRWSRYPVRYGATHPLDVEVYGLKLRLMPRGNLSESKLLFAPQFFDRAELQWLAARLPVGSTFLDIGANAGGYSFWVRSQLGDNVRILAVEPDPEMRRRIEFNCATNAIRNIELCPVALSDHRGQAGLNVNTTQRGANSLSDSSVVRDGSVGVEVDTLLHLLQSRNVTRVDALKIDIEGHEPRALGHFFAQAPATLWPQAVIIEHKPETAPVLLEMFQGRNYRRVAETRLNWMFQRDG